MDILVKDGKIVGYLGTMIKSLEKMAGKGNVHLTYENVKEVKGEINEVSKM